MVSSDYSVKFCTRILDSTVKNVWDDLVRVIAYAKQIFYMPGISSLKVISYLDKLELNIR